jgi:hypothetical protein
MDAPHLRRSEFAGRVLHKIHLSQKCDWLHFQRRLSPQKRATPLKQFPPKKWGIVLALPQQPKKYHTHPNQTKISKRKKNYESTK